MVAKAPAHAKRHTMKNGWSIAVSGRARGSGAPVTRHYLVAIESEQLAREAVEKVIDANATIVGATKIERRHLEHRNMAENDVLELGGR